MSDSSDPVNRARRAGRETAEHLRRVIDERAARAAAELAPLAAAQLADDGGEPARMPDLDAEIRLPDQDQRESRRTTPMSFALRADLKDRLNKFRSEGGNINVSGIANDAIERELDRMESGNAVVQRLRVELTDRRGPSWTMGYQAGRKWAEEIASWLEITAYATRYTDRDVKVLKLNGDDEADPDMYVMFLNSFHAPERDYGRDVPGHTGAPSFSYLNTEGEQRWQYTTYELEAYWRAWLRAVREVYDENQAYLPSVIDQLSDEDIPDPNKPRDVDPNDIPF